MACCFYIILILPEFSLDQVMHVYTLKVWMSFVYVYMLCASMHVHFHVPHMQRIKCAIKAQCLIFLPSSNIYEYYVCKPYSVSRLNRLQCTSVCAITICEVAYEILQNSGLCRLNPLYGSLCVFISVPMYRK